MSDNNHLAGGKVSDRDDPLVKESDALRSQITSMHSDISATADSLKNEVIITAAALPGIYFQPASMINVYENIPFAGGDGDYSILSVLFGAHSIGDGIFGYLNMIDSNKVRLLCKECRQAVMDFPWMDDKSDIKGSVKAWRLAFPVARAVNVSNRYDFVDADFVHIRGDARVRLHTVNITYCRNVTDAAFVNLRGIHTLIMIGCNQATITDAALVNLREIPTLDTS